MESSSSPELSDDSDAEDPNIKRKDTTKPKDKSKTDVLDADWFVDKLHDAVFCSICGGVLRQPKACVEGHTYCHPCIEEWLRVGEDQQCPQCRKSISLSGAGAMSDNRPLGNIIADLRLRCKHASQGGGDRKSETKAGVTTEALTSGSSSSCGSASEGLVTGETDSTSKTDSGACPWEGRVSDLEGHLTKCDYEQDQCSYCDDDADFTRCSFRGTRKSVNAHADACQFRFVHCECGLWTKAQCLPNHVATACQNVRVECMHCKSRIQRKEMGVHLLSDCPLAPAPCPFESVGCNRDVGVLTRSSMSEHYTKNMEHHLDTVMREVVGQRAVIGKLEHRLDDFYAMLRALQGTSSLECSSSASTSGSSSTSSCSTSSSSAVSNPSSTLQSMRKPKKSYTHTASSAAVSLAASLTASTSSRSSSSSSAPPPWMQGTQRYIPPAVRASSSTSSTAPSTGGIKRKRGTHTPTSSDEEDS